MIPVALAACSRAIYVHFKCFRTSKSSSCRQTQRPQAQLVSLGRPARQKVLAKPWGRHCAVQHRYIKLILPGSLVMTPKGPASQPNSKRCAQIMCRPLCAGFSYFVFYVPQTFQWCYGYGLVCRYVPVVASLSFRQEKRERKTKHQNVCGFCLQF